ncbi:nucleotidyl transferase AbiEii/AbiGii toxin family protein [Dyadobacter arcticus]|uniref:Nucleotidyl transferase AbiEii toxin, Type IV TA system n=1 Tax=Dyadobacter arcticus TaxID=1078754 RepID=A0ABX0UL92_9BACT|nr:nucleotidyl transferase AbiEii/AbiGii toxin family protein [Dyadobacter arcticus]NIJ53726.1 hypothetical protein [Dyadobacter arcticus]
MLHTQTVTKPTLEILRGLLNLPEMSGFALVGGTNLSLRFGHRISIDLDLFTSESFDLQDLRETIRDKFPKSLELSARKQTLLLNIDGVKTDMMRHSYAVLKPVETIEGIRLMSLPDVAAMKLGAVAGRGAKKDFWDIHKLLEMYSVEEMISFYNLKYPDSDPSQVLRSLVYFEDADQQPNPEDLQNTSWDQIKLKISEQVKNYTKDAIG